MADLPRINDAPAELWDPDAGDVAWTNSEEEPGVVIARDGSRWAVPVCIDCGHGACPCCKVWCDVVTGDAGDEDREPCCDMACTYSAEDVERFELQVA